MTRPAARRTLAALVALMAGSGAAGQEPDSLRADSLRAVNAVVPPAPDSVEAAPTTPRGAMFRSFVLPGWGQAEYDAYFRGGIYFAGWAGNWLMNFRNAVRLDQARGRLGVRRQQIREGLIASSSDPDSMRAQLDSFPSILNQAVRQDELGNELRKIVSSREQQQEDWIAWSLFWLLASGVDAYVTAHLSDFPADIEIRPERDRSVSLRVGVPWPARPRPPDP